MKVGGLNLSGLLTSSSGAELPPCTHQPDSLNAPFSALLVECACLSIEGEQEGGNGYGALFKPKGNVVPYAYTFIQIYTFTYYTDN